MEVKAWFDCPNCGSESSTNFSEVPCPGCCEECIRIDRDGVALVNDERKLLANFKKLWDHIDTFHKRISKTHKGNGAFQGQFAFTLTFSPNDNLTKEDLLVAVRKLMGQKSCPVKTYAWYLEYGDMENQTHPHIHGMYETETGGRIEAKHFKRAWKIWDEKQRLGQGFRGGYHRPVRDKEAYSDYIGKYDLEHDSFLPQ